MSNILENRLVDHIFRGNAFAMPTQLWVALYSSDPGETGASGELSGGGYGRAALAPSTANWAATNGVGNTSVSSTGTTGATSNNVIITFPTPTANWNGGNAVTHFAIFDASTGGNMLLYGALLNNGKVVQQNDTVTFPPGQLQIIFA
jgi:hypothetical protein